MTLVTPVRRREAGVDLSGDVALEAADDLVFGQSLVGPAFNVVAGWFVVA